MNYYERLHISETATPEEIKKAFRRLAKELHPDMNRDRDTTEEFVALEVAYSCLSNKHSRLAYDQLLRFEREKIHNPAMNRRYASTIHKRTAPRRKKATYHSNLSYQQYVRDEKYSSSLLGIVLKTVFLLGVSSIYFGWLISTGSEMSRQIERGIEPDMPPQLFGILTLTALPVIIGITYLYEPLVKLIVVGKPKRKVTK